MDTSVESVVGDTEFDFKRKWDDGTATNSRTLELDSWSYIQHQNYNLQLLQKKEPPPDRQTIPANTKERLAYFRCYVSSASKTQIIPLQVFSFNVFFWNHIVTLFMKSLPTSYITLFLSSYASRDHFYIPKMVPWFRGSNIAIVICGVFDLTFSSQYLMVLLYYTLCGLYHHSPWFECDPNNVFGFRAYAVRCVTPDEFARIFENETAGVDREYDFHITPDGEKVALSPILFYEVTEDLVTLGGNKPILFICLPFVIFTISSLHYKALFKRFIWRFMDYTHLIMNIIYGVAMVHLTYSYFEKKMKDIHTHNMILRIAMVSDPGLVSESLTAPPVLHLLTSRSADQIRPGRDSAMLMASNTIYYIFRGVLLFRIKKYCDSTFNAPIGESYDFSEPYPDLYLFPLYFSTFQYGYLFTLIYFTCSFLMELITYIITYQCLLEAVVCEWPKLRKWMLTILLNIIILTIIFTFTLTTNFLLYFLSKGVTSLLEIIAICWFYPLGRLIDDITFHLGSMPLDIRILNLKILPFYYTVKIYFTFNGIMNLLNVPSDKLIYIWIVTYTPVSLGFVYSLMKYILVKNKHVKDLLRPLPSFGPNNHIIRQLRKQYDGREYITSQASRYLSRHLIAKSEADTHKLDICYARKRSTVYNLPEMHFESDKADDTSVSRRRSATARREAHVALH